MRWILAWGWLSCVVVTSALLAFPALASGQEIDTDSLRHVHRARAEIDARLIAEAAATFTNRGLAVGERIAAVEGIGGFDRPQDIERTIAIVFDREQPDRVRERAVQLVAPETARDQSFRVRLLQLVQRQDEPLQLRRSGMHGLEDAMFSWHTEHQEDEVVRGLRQLMRDPDRFIRTSALRLLAARGDEEALELLERELQSPSEESLPPPTAVSLLSLSNPAPYYPVLRRVLATSSDQQTRVAVIHALSGDEESRSHIVRILQSSQEGLVVRRAALAALAAGDPVGLAPRVLPIVGDREAPMDLRIRSIKAMELLRTTRDRSALAARSEDAFDRRVEQLAAEAPEGAIRAVARDYLRRTKSVQ